MPHLLIDNTAHVRPRLFDRPINRRSRKSCVLSRISFDRVKNFPSPRVDHLAIGGREPFRKANIIELVSPGVEASAGWVFLCIGAGIKGTRAWLGELITRSRHRSRLACHRKLARTRGTRSVVGSHPRGSKPRLRGARNATSWTWCNDRMQPWRDVTFARFPANAS